MIDAPFRHESDTSRAAAEKLTTAQRNRSYAMGYIRSQGSEGATIDEVCIHLTSLLGREVPPNAISGRFIELEKQGMVSKTPMRRKTRAGRDAVVYIAGSWKDNLPPAPKPPPPQDSQLEVYRRGQAAYGHGHVIPRNDGRKEGCGGIHACGSCRKAKAYFDMMENKNG